MTTLPIALGGEEFVIWRLDRNIHASGWDSGEGAFQFGGRWNSKGVRCVYCSIDPSTAIVEIAVHKGFKVLTSIPHTLTAAVISSRKKIHIVQAEDLPDPNWLKPGAPKPDQQRFGDYLLERHRFVAIPSTVSKHSWNLIFVASNVGGEYRLKLQEDFILDPRLSGS